MNNKRQLYVVLFLVVSIIVAVINWHRGIDVVAIILIWSSVSWFVGFQFGRDEGKQP